MVVPWQTMLLSRAYPLGQIQIIFPPPSSAQLPPSHCAASPALQALSAVNEKRNLFKDSYAFVSKTPAKDGFDVFLKHKHSLSFY